MSTRTQRNGGHAAARGASPYRARPTWLPPVGARGARHAGAVHGAPVTIRGVIGKVFRASPGWSAALVAPEGGGEAVKCAGSYYARESEHVVVEGRWKLDKTHGMGVEVTSAAYVMPADAHGLARYIADNPAFIGFGPTKAARLADWVTREYEGDLSRALADVDPARLAKVCGVTVAKMEALAAEWRSREGTNAAATFLASFGLTSHQIDTVMEEFGATVVAVLQDDPFALLGKLPRYGFKRLDLIACKMGLPKSAPSRCRQGIAQCVRDAADQDGHTLVEEQDLLSAAQRILELDTLAQRDALPTRLAELVACGALTRDVVAGRTFYALPHLFEAEGRIVRTLAGSFQPNPTCPDMTKARAHELIEAHGAALNPGQRAAVSMVLLHAVSVLTGAAGCGKTFALAALIAICDALRIEVTPCAPTGKAAQRMEQATGRAACTLHMLLGYKGKKFTRTEPLPAGLVVIDESSMVDSPLLAEVFKRLDPTRTAILLVGDHHQLPPVGAGAPLRDILRTHAAPSTVLDVVVRQAGLLKANSTAILQGHVAPSQDRRAGDTTSEWFVLAKQAEDAEENAARVLDLATNLIPDRLGFDAIADVQVLSPMHDRANGVQALNRALQRALQLKVYGIAVPAAPEGGPEGEAPGEDGSAEPAQRRRKPSRAATALYLGDKVIHKRNDYQAGVMNGTQGRVRWAGVLGDPATSKRRAAVVVFDGRHVLYTMAGEPLEDDAELSAARAAIPEPLHGLVDWLAPASLKDLHLAYALTVHSVQGSEFPCVLVVCHKAHTIMHRRELLYTAVTRARQTVLVVGDHWAIANCVAQDTSEERRTWIPLLLGGLRRAAPAPAALSEGT